MVPLHRLNPVKYHCVQNGHLGLLMGLVLLRVEVVEDLDHVDVYWKEPISQLKVVKDLESS